MKSVYTSLFLLISLSSARAQMETSEKTIKQFGFSTIKFPYLFIYTTEISNLHYTEFVFWTRKYQGEKAAQLIYPDTLVWRNALTFNEPYVKYYFQHPAYRNYPVVGISYYKAVAFCNWMAERIMETPEFKKSAIAKISIRLPSEKEWMMAARGTLGPAAAYPWPGEQIRITEGKKKDIGKFRLNMTNDYEDYGGIFSDMYNAGFITTPVNSYWPNTFNLYNMCGNVAEWVEEKYAKGGSWRSFAYNTRIDQIQAMPYDSMSTSTVGFRPLLEIVSYKPLPYHPMKLTAKAIEAMTVKVTDSLYAARYETTNQLYHEYINDTRNSSDFITKHSLDIIDVKKWALYSRYPFFEQYGSHALFNNYPVVNISHESAKNFCEWLTKKYHQNSDRAYKEVVFRLPDEKEWEKAASGNLKAYIYPWGGPYCRNSKGNYLANFHPFEEQYNFSDAQGNHFYLYPDNDSTVSRGVDGAVFPAEVKNYFPNAIGLYQCAGNVAEMVAEKGISKGGSWTSHQYFIQIASKETYSSSNANLGFRFVMEIKQR